NPRWADGGRGRTACPGEAGGARISRFSVTATGGGHNRLRSGLGRIWKTPTSGIPGVQAGAAGPREGWSSCVAGVGSLNRTSQPFRISTGFADGTTRYSWRGVGLGSTGKTPNPFFRIVYRDD